MPDMPPTFQRMYTIGIIILCDQISRNVFRNSARAYATDKLARRLAAPLLEEFDAGYPFGFVMGCAHSQVGKIIDI